MFEVFGHYQQHPFPPLCKDVLRSVALGHGLLGPSRPSSSPTAARRARPPNLPAARLTPGPDRPDWPLRACAPASPVQGEAGHGGQRDPEQVRCPLRTEVGDSQRVRLSEPCPCPGVAVLGEGSWRTAGGTGRGGFCCGREPTEDPPHRLPQPLAPRPSGGTCARSLAAPRLPGLGGPAECPSVAKPTLPGHHHPGAGRTGGGQDPGTLRCRLCLPQSEAGRLGHQGQRRPRDPLVWGRLAPGGVSVLGGAEGGSVLQVPATGARPRPCLRGLAGPPGWAWGSQAGGGPATRTSPSAADCPPPAPALGCLLWLRPPRAPASLQLPPQPPEAPSPPFPTAHAAVQAR